MIGAARLRVLVFAASLALPIAAPAQPPPPSLVQSYGRVAALLDYMTGYVGEILLACAEKKVLSEAAAEARYQGYRARNAELLGRVERWQQAAERKLQARGEAQVAQQFASESATTAMAAASLLAQEQIGGAADARAACGARLEAFESGRYDLSSNAEFVRLLREEP